jgi:hypothetical protein
MNCICIYSLNRNTPLPDFIEGISDYLFISMDCQFGLEFRIIFFDFLIQNTVIYNSVILFPFKNFY